MRPARAATKESFVNEQDRLDDPTPTAGRDEERAPKAGRRPYESPRVRSGRAFEQVLLQSYPVST